MAEAAKATREGEPESGLALERAVPALAGKLPRAVCTRLPTRVHSLERLGKATGADLWIKRDDETGTLYGGNKPRKLEFVLGDAIARRKRTVMTFGGIGTNHGLATAIYARQHGLRTLLVLLRQPVTAKVRHGLLLYHAAEAEMHYAPTVPRLALKAVALCARRVLSGDGLPYIIPAGGSAPVGVVGYVNAAFELKQQVDAGLLPAPDWIFVPVGTAGTFAGLVLGCRLAGLSSRVVGVLVTDILPPTAASTVRMAQRTQAILRRRAPSLPEVRLAAADIHLVHGFVGPSYGTPTPAARAARKEIEELEGIHVETTYTGKCLAALRSLASVPPYRGSRLLYWHTYSSVDPTEHLGPLADFHDLPPAFHRFFEGSVIED